MAKMNPHSKILWSSPIFFALLISSSCDSKPSELEKMDEAYEVGYLIGIADTCGRTDESLMMPKSYDDSLDSGLMATAFKNGYNAANASDEICQYGPRSQ